MFDQKLHPKISYPKREDVNRRMRKLHSGEPHDRIKKNDLGGECTTLGTDAEDMLVRITKRGNKLRDLVVDGRSGLVLEWLLSRVRQWAGFV